MNNEEIKREEFGTVAIIHIGATGFDSASASAIAAACMAMRPITVLDFADVAFINSDGISALLRFIAVAQQSGCKLFAMNVSPHHQKMFKAVEVARFMPVIQERDLVAYRQGEEYSRAAPQITIT